MNKAEEWKEYLKNLSDEKLREIEAAIDVLLSEPKFKEDFGILGAIGFAAWHEGMKREYPEALGNVQ